MTQEMRATALAEAVKNAQGNYDADNLVKMAEAFYAFLATKPEVGEPIKISKDLLREKFGYGRDSKYLEQMCSDLESMSRWGILPPITVAP